MLKRINEIYSNCSLYDQRGLLCYCSYSRARWYIKKGLATIVSEQPLSIRLNFEPNISQKQRESIYNVRKENKCCVCGNRELSVLTRHHIVPFAFRKAFPDVYKSSLSHDIIPVCDDCHVKYNKHALAKIDKMFLECETIQNNQKKWFFMKETWGICKALMTKGIPEKRRQELCTQLYRDWDTKYTIEDIAKICKTETPNKKDYARLYVEELDCLDDFIMMWRLDFLNIMKPRFLPEGWSVNFKTCNF